MGSLPPSVYWRRRAVFAGVLLAVLLLAVISVVALRSKGGGNASAGSTPAGSTPAGSTPAVSSSRASVSPSSSTPAPSSSAPAACTTAQLAIAATTNAPSYVTGAQPVVEMQVTNKGPQPCVQGLGDPQIEFRVFNGAARVWGSHDCKIDSTPDVQTLVVGKTVAKTVVWSGYSSQVACAGTRQVVGAGTYTLYVYLSGAQGTTAQFTINPAATSSSTG